MKITFKNTTPSKFVCNEYPRFYYTISRKNYHVKTEVFDGEEKMVEFDKNYTEGWFVLFILFGEEGNMNIVFKKSHKQARKTIENSLKNGC